MLITIFIVLGLLFILFGITIYSAIKIASISDKNKGEKWKQEEIFFMI